MNTEAETTETPREAILRVAKELGLAMESHFVPFSQSRNKGDKSPSLNWQITLFKGDGTVAGGRAILTTDYMAGCGNCPSYSFRGPRTNKAITDWECENGYAGMWFAGDVRRKHNSKPIRPDLADVLSSLVADAGVINSSGFEEWASEYGYDTDSRKAEAIYRTCIDIALKLRNGLGEAGLEALRAATQDF